MPGSWMFLEADAGVSGWESLGIVLNWADARGFVGSITSDGQRLSFNYAPAPVPLPAALWLMLGAMTSMGIVGRRSSTQRLA